MLLFRPLVSSILLAGSTIVLAQAKPEADVYAVLREARFHGVQGDKMVVIDRTIALPTLADASSDWLKEFDAVPATLRQAASRRSPTKPGPLDPAMFPAGTRLSPQAGIDALFSAQNANGWPAFKRQYGAEGWMSFSDVLFTPDRLDALVYYEANCGGLCGEGGYAWLHRDSDQSRWLLKKKIVSWMA